MGGSWIVFGVYDLRSPSSVRILRNHIEFYRAVTAAMYSDYNGLSAKFALRTFV